MSRYLLDSNTAVALIDKRGNVPEQARDARRQGHRIGIGMPVLAELYYGIEFSASRDKNLDRLHRALSNLTIWPFDQLAAAEFGRQRADLRRRGRPMQVIDIMVAAIALTLGDCVVVTTDADFASIPGLNTVNWLAEARGNSE